MRKSDTVSLAALAAAIAVLPTGAAQAATSAGGQAVLEEVVVTARKRPENVQRTPIAITTVTGEDLQARGVTSLSGLESLTPGLTLRGNAPISGNPSAAVVFLRGVGQLDFSIFTDPGVGIYLDGVYVARSTGALLDLVDPERVEILRGPQGTLFGRNTIGGAISVVSKKPAEEFGGSITGTTGSYSRAQLQGEVNVPLSDTVFTQFSGFAHKREGYVKRLQTGEDLGNDNALAGRAQVLWKPTENFSALLSLDGTRKRENGSPTVPVQLRGTGYVNLAKGDAVRPVAGNSSFAYLFNKNSKTHPANSLCTTNPDASRDCFGKAWETNDPYATNGTYPAKANLDIFGTSLTLEQALPFGQLRSISAYRTLDNDYGKDTDHTPYDVTHITYTDKQKQFSQELQLTGDSFGKRLKWLLGAYYFSETGRETFDNFNPLATTLADTHIENRNYAGFGEATLDATDWLHLTAGARYTHETKRFRTDQFIGYQDPDVIAANPLYGTLAGKRLVKDNSWQEQSYSKWTPRLTAAADLSDDAIVYVTYSQGFKSGGFDGRYVPGFNSSTFQFVLFDRPNRYDPEELTVYEAGLKYTTPDHRLRINTAIFRSDYENLQVPYVPPGNLGVSYISNAARARIDGVEVEAAWLPIDGLQITGGASYLNARYLRIDPARVPTIALSNDFPVTPKWTANLSAAYTIDLASRGVLTPRINWAYRSSQTNDAENRPTSRQPGYHLVNASLAYDSPDKLWRTTVAVTNLGDERYLTSLGSGSSFGVIEGVYGRPREWSLSLQRSF